MRWNPEGRRPDLHDPQIVDAVLLQADVIPNPQGKPTEDALPALRKFLELAELRRDVLTSTRLKEHGPIAAMVSERFARIAGALATITDDPEIWRSAMRAVSPAPSRVR